jgi:hypothetical protein
MAGKSLGTAQHLLGRVTGPGNKAGACSSGCFNSETWTALPAVPRRVGPQGRTPGACVEGAVALAPPP